MNTKRMFMMFVLFAMMFMAMSVFGVDNGVVEGDYNTPTPSPTGCVMGNCRPLTATPTMMMPTATATPLPYHIYLPVMEVSDGN